MVPCLIGLVACVPRPVGGDGDVRFLLLTQRDAGGGSVDRHRIILPARHAPDIAKFSPGAIGYVEGHLACTASANRSPSSPRGPARAPAPPAPEQERPTGTYAYPREHQRTRHARRVAIGTARERVVWVGLPPSTRHRVSPSQHRTRVRIERGGSLFRLLQRDR